MAHRGEELALGFGGRQGLLVRFHQLDRAAFHFQRRLFQPVRGSPLVGDIANNL